MTKTNWAGLSASDLGREIEAGRICPVQLTEEMLDKITKHPDGTRIYARLTRKRALDEAMAARGRARAGLRRGPLDGVPVSWKDLFDTANIATEAGTALLRGRVPTADAEVLRAMTLAGTICLGKTHMT
ncbi:amidase family protein, partial [Roseinatronobacter sp.]|uniref:amidase family protein n=1 Tax=Roseinatronobacter sp. TaxID=1945755 RepID=UPI0025F16A43